MRHEPPLSSLGQTAETYWEAVKSKTPAPPPPKGPRRGTSLSVPAAAPRTFHVNFIAVLAMGVITLAAVLGLAAMRGHSDRAVAGMGAAQEAKALVEADLAASVEARQELQNRVNDLLAAADRNRATDELLLGEFELLLLEGSAEEIAATLNYLAGRIQAGTLTDSQLVSLVLTKIKELIPPAAERFAEGE